MIYLDHARTSHPKLPCISEAISHYINDIGVPPSRESHPLARKACDVFERARKKIGSLFHIPQHNHIFFSSNATEAANIILKGFLKENDHVLITAYEHNCIVRPLHTLKQEKGISYSILYPEEDGSISLERFAQSITPHTKLITTSHIANSTGYVAPIHAMAKIAKEKGVPFLVDASQSAGLLDLDVEKEGIDFLIFTGHKHLLGPSGIGGGYVRHPEKVSSLIQGGSYWGSSLSPFHPETAPHKFEAGTPNYLGIAALEASLSHIEEIGIDSIHAKIKELTDYFMKSIKQVPRIHLLSKEETCLSMGSFTMDDLLPGEAAQVLFEKYSILVRSGILCAPLIHTSLQTHPNGVIRASFGYSNSFEEIDHLIHALLELSGESS